jgi:hypothetical protein
MRQVEAYVFRRLLLVGILIVGCAGLSFGGGGVDRTGGGATIPEVVDKEYPLNRYPGATRASTDVYALPAASLSPVQDQLPPPVFAVSGVKNQEIKELWEIVDVWVVLRDKVTFARGLVEGTQVNDWIPNLPAGLVARVHNVKKKATSVRIYIDGTPTETARREIQVVIPGTYLSSGASQEFFSPNEDESRRAWEESQTAALEE